MVTDARQQVTSITRHLLPDGTTLTVSPRGTMRDRALGNGVVHSVCRGLQSDEFAAYTIQVAEEQIRTHRRAVFLVDSVESKMMTTGFREQMTEWFRKNKQHAQVHMLIHSKVLEMALNLANLLIGVAAAKAYTNIADWEAVGRSFVPGFRRSSLVLPEDYRSLLPDA